MTNLTKIVCGICILIYGCQSKSNQQKYHLDYSKMKESFTTKHFAHFPSALNDSNYFFDIVPPSKAKDWKRSGVVLVRKLTQESAIHLKRKIIDSVQYTYKPGDSCLLVVNLFERKIGGDVFLKRYKGFCNEEFVPIPNFSKTLKHLSLNVFTKDNRLKNDFTMYVLEAEPGEFLPSGNLTEGIGLPEKWHNGYSRGIVINEKDGIIIYWLEIW